MTTFFIAPYEPTDDPEKWEALKTASDLQIDPGPYRRQLLEAWPLVEFFSTTPVRPLQWSFYTAGEDGEPIPCGIASLQANRQVVSISAPYEDYVLWHRKVIPAEHRLYLFNASAWDSLELKPETTLDEIRAFVGEGGEAGDVG